MYFVILFLFSSYTNVKPLFAILLPSIMSLPWFFIMWVQNCGFYWRKTFIFQLCPWTWRLLQAWGNLLRKSWKSRIRSISWSTMPALWWLKKPSLKMATRSKCKSTILDIFFLLNFWCLLWKNLPQAGFWMFLVLLTLGVSWFNEKSE